MILTHRDRFIGILPPLAKQGTQSSYRSSRAHVHRCTLCARIGKRGSGIKTRTRAHLAFSCGLRRAADRIGISTAAMTSAPRRRLHALPASQPLLPLSALGSGSRLRRGTDRSCAYSHQRRNRCRKGWILRGRAGDARRQLEENIPMFQASDILNAFYLLLLRIQHEKRVDYAPRWLAVSMQKYPHGQLPFPNRYPPIPVLTSLADPRYSSRESPF
jgi:hypothetical protein